MEKYRHKVNYYETDRMGITHHSNYLRFMEEARVDFLEKIGWGYDKLEAMGIISPVTAVSCQYKESTTFNDNIDVYVRVKDFKGVKLVIEYEMIKTSNGHTALIGTSEHCFLNSSLRPVRLDRECPEFYTKLRELAQEQEGQA